MSELKGVIKVIGETINVSEKFSKRDLVVTDNSGMYPQDILLQLQKDKCSLVDGLNVGDEVNVFYNLNGKEWTNPQGEVKYFNTLSAWKIDRLNVSTQAPTPTTTQPNDLPWD
jgi:hypothetical protein